MTRPAIAMLAAIVLLAPLLGAELGVRALIADDRLIEAPTSNDIADVAVANLQRLGRPDVLIIGNSTTRNALQPDVLESLLGERTGREVAVQGMAQGALGPESLRVMVAGLAARDLLPDTVIVGLSPGLFLLGDDRDWFAESSLGRTWSGCGSVQLEAMPDCLLSQVSALWRWRGHPDRIVASALGGMPRTYDHRGRVLQENGWTWERPATRRRLQRVLPETLARLPSSPLLPPSEVDRYVALIDELRAHGVTVVVATQPYAPPLVEALLERNPSWLDELRAAYQQLEEASGQEIVQVEAYGDWWTPAAQHDLRHLSHEGAGPFTEQLWDDASFRRGLLAGVSSGA